MESAFKCKFFNPLSNAKKGLAYAKSIINYSLYELSFNNISDIIEGNEYNAKKLITGNILFELFVVVNRNDAVYENEIKAKLKANNR